MSSDRNGCESFKGLLSGNQVNTLDRETLLACVAEKSISDLGSAERVYLLHDPLRYTQALCFGFRRFGQGAVLAKDGSEWLFKFQ